MSLILEEISNAIGEKTPSKLQELVPFIRKANKNSPPEVFSKYSKAVQEYLKEASTCLRQGKAINPPDDFVERDEIEDSEDDDLPDDINCETHQKLHSVRELMMMIREQELKVPDLQRDFVWNTQKQQEFLGAMLRGFPTLNLMFAIDDTSHVRYVLDGLQRLHTLQMFTKDLVVLGANSPYPGKKFSELPVEVKNKINLATLGITEIHTERKHWRHIFCQINKGGLKLTDMEIRRALYTHRLITELESMAKNHQYWIATFGKNRRYAGLEALLRAVAMHYSYQDYKKPVKLFLDAWCLQIDEHDIDIDQLITNLDLILEALWTTFGKSTFNALSKKTQINLGLVDTLIHGGLLLIENSEQMPTLDDLASKLQTLKANLLVDSRTGEPETAFTKDTSGRDAVLTRMHKVRELLQLAPSASEDAA